EDDDGIKGFSFYITRATTPEQIELTAYRPSSGVFSDYALDTSGLTEGDYTLFLVAVDDHPTASTPAIAELPFQVRHDASSPPGPCAVDDTRPSIDLLTPEDGEVIATDDVVLEATADDGPNGTGISQVKFYVNGGRAIHTATSPPYRTTWQATPGVHAIKARAYDECGNIRSETATVIVGEAVCGTSPAPPVVTLVAPEDGSALEPGLTDIQVTASAPAGVERVELFIDRRPIHVLEEAPFDFGFWFSVEGTYRLEARAYDACGQSTLSEPTMVRVTHSAPPCASDSNPPSVEVTAPVDGVPQPHGEVTLVATAEDPELFVAWVIFEIDGVVPDNGVVMAPPYSITWQGEPGEHTVKVWAEDVCGNVAATPPTTFTLFNERPRPLPDQATTRAGSAVVIPVLANDSDPNGDPIQLAINEPFPEQPAHGAVAIQGEDVVYTPHPGFGSSAGEIDTFWYRIVDPHGGFRATKVTVVVLDMP
ncbi:MAG: Ig-like domain-containing protein, partial [Acidobacteriota bacterium]